MGGGEQVSVKLFYPERRIAESREQLHQALDRVLDSGTLVGGMRETKFESEYAGLCGRAFAVGTGNGLDALEIALRASGVSPGDVVLVPSYTFIATWISVHRLGAVPVGVDVDIDTGLMSIQSVLSRLEEVHNVSAIVPVHLYGGAVDIAQLIEQISASAIRIVDDCAQAHGHEALARLPRHKAPDASAYSFYPTKNLGAYGDGGCVLTNSSALAETARSLSSYGRSEEKYVYERLGVNSRLDPIQAAFLHVELSHLGSRNQRRRKIAEHYLAQSPLVCESVVSSWRTSGDLNSSVWHQFVVLSNDRPRLREFLFRFGVDTGQNYPYVAADEFERLTGTLSQNSTGNFRDFNGARFLAAKATTIPIDPGLTDGEVERVADALKASAAVGLLSSDSDESGVAL